MKAVLLFVVASTLNVWCMGRHQTVDITNISSAKSPPVDWALREINKYYESQGDSKKRLIKSINKGTIRQVSDKLLYHFRVVLNGGAKREHCQVDIVYGPSSGGTREFTLDKMNCEHHKVNKVKSKSTMGGMTETTLTDPIVQDALKLVTRRFNSEHCQSCDYYQTSISAKRVAYGVIAGMRYEFKELRFAESNCTQEEGMLDETFCIAYPDREILRFCNYIVLYLVSNHDYEVTLDECSTGGPEDV